MLHPTTDDVPAIGQCLPLLFYCHDSLRFGSSARAALLASLSAQFRIIAVAEDPARLAGVPPHVEVVGLPAHGSFSSRTARRQSVMDMYSCIDPAVVVIEQYPFGCREISDDVVAVLDAAAA